MKTTTTKSAFFVKRISVWSLFRASTTTKCFYVEYFKEFAWTLAFLIKSLNSFVSWFESKYKKIHIYIYISNIYLMLVS